MASVFTRIIKREIPGQVLWEDSTFAVIMDANPVDVGHLLVVPKKEEDSLFSLPSDQYHRLWEIVRWLEGPLRRAIGSPRIGIAVEGFGVAHVHVHMVPVYRGGDLNPHRAKAALPKELAVVAARIRREIETEMPNQTLEPTSGKMEDRVSLRSVKTDDLPIFFVHQLDPEATKLAAFPSRDRDAFFSHWTTNILGNPAAVSRTILAGNHVAGNIGAWTDAASNERLICYWIGREFWGRGIASAALSQFLRFELTRPLSARVAKHNLGSIRVLEKAGFVRAGEDSFSSPSAARIEEFIYFLAA